MSTATGDRLDLAVVGNCEVSALVDGMGRLVWMCLPRPDGDPIFSALLTQHGGNAERGIFAIDLIDQTSAEQRYVRNTAIVETILRDTRGGAVRITDFCPRYRTRGRIYRPMTLIRIIEPLDQRPVLRLRFRPTTGYGAQLANGRAGSHHLRFSNAGVDYRLTTDMSINFLLEDRPVILEKPITFILGPDETIQETPEIFARMLLEETRSYWQDWVRTLAVPFDWQEEVIRAAITLKLCTYEDTGAVLAALTTSIPESPNSGRTWDYRYCWLRDSYFVVQALNRLGATRTMEGYLHYIDHLIARTSVGDLQPLYGITGEPKAEERLIESLDGFAGMGPVRVGNQAATQIQHDVYGAVILAASQLFFDERLVRPGNEALLAQLELLGDRATAIYELPDAGPWEFRGKQLAHTFSAAMSWAGCDRLARITERLGMQTKSRRWRTCADAMRSRILHRAWNERRQSFSGTLGGEDLDATLLLLPELGLLPATDPRFRATLDLIGRELRTGDLLFRYRHPDDFGTPECTFTVCAFWYVNALAATGQIKEAREHFSRLLARRNPMGLLSEDIDPATGIHWGNFPQTYSMVGVINSALRLTRSWEEAL